MTNENNTPPSASSEPSGAPRSEPSPGERVVHAAMGDGAWSAVDPHIFFKCVDDGINAGVIGARNAPPDEIKSWEELGLVRIDRDGAAWVTLKGLAVAVSMAMEIAE